MKGCVLNKIQFSENGHKISFDYEMSKSFSKYFNIDNKFYVSYDKDVQHTPLSIAVIPFLSNIMPIAWFAGFDVHIDELDKTFYNSLNELRTQFEKHHPEIKNNGKLICKKLVTNTFVGNNAMLLFSGGLDSFESLTRNFEENPYLVSIHGADIEIKDTKRWSDFKRFNKEETIVSDNRLIYIETNVRDFYTYKVDLLVNSISWWGEIQHGMALLGVLAPLTNLLQVNHVFIASSNTKEVDFSWGSRPEVDENMNWADLKITHDGYHLRRTEKIVNVINFAKKNNENINLRVCYSELRNGANCNMCAKCQRTILGIILGADDPSKYGLQIPDNFYDLLLSNFNETKVMSTGLEYEWRCLQEKAMENKPFFIINNKEIETAHLAKFKALELTKIINRNEVKTTKSTKNKFILRNKFSELYNVYKKIRYN